MNDPYQILNIPPTATDEEVKRAYRDLARKYHPDNYHDNPLADLAQEKMKEINEPMTRFRSSARRLPPPRRATPTATAAGIAMATPLTAAPMERARSIRCAWRSTAAISRSLNVS